MKEIGNKIREVRKKKGLAQEELADASGINLRTIQRIENNESEPRGKTLHLICDVLGINAEDILDYGKKSDRSYLVILHFSVMIFLVIPIGNIILPLILWMSQKDKIVGLKEVGANLLNFQIVWSVVTFISITTFSLLRIMHIEGHMIFLYLFLTLYVVNFITPVIFGIATRKGHNGNLYPRIITLVK